MHVIQVLALKSNYQVFHTYFLDKEKNERTTVRAGIITTVKILE
jgi:hypothetical protein